MFKKIAVIIRQCIVFYNVLPVDKENIDVHAIMKINPNTTPNFNMKLNNVCSIANK